MNIILCDISFWKDFFSIVQSAATAIALFVGGLWAWNRYYKQRENRPLIVFSADIKFHAIKNDYWIVELIAYIENKGKVQHRVSKFDFILEALRTEEMVKLDAEHRKQVKFPFVLVESTFLPDGKNNTKAYETEEELMENKKNEQLQNKKEISSRRKKILEYFFIEPGLKNKYSYITRIPLNAEVVLMHTWFEYKRPVWYWCKKKSHTAEVTKRVPRSIDEILPKKKED